MSRRRRATKRQHQPDSLYGSPLVSQLINVVMKSGKRSIAEKIVYTAISKVSEKLEKGNAVELLLGGATYQVPVEVTIERQNSMALRWLAAAAQGRKGSTMAESLAAELVDAYNNTGNVVKKREETHKMAQANKAFAHLRW
jgi:small subunit ribosomal protein S7